MKRIKKITAALIAAFVLLLPLGTTVFAADLVNPDNIKAMLEIFSIDVSNLDLSDPESIRNFINELQSGGLGGLLNSAGLNKILNELQEYLFAFESETKPQETTTEEPTTEEPTTEAPTTETPTTAPTYPSYTPPTYAPPTTLPPVETTTFQYIPPEQIYTEAYTTTVFQPVVEDELNIDSDVNPLKTALGVVLLLGSGIGVIVVVLALKRNRI